MKVQVLPRDHLVGVLEQWTSDTAQPRRWSALDALPGGGSSEAQKVRRNR